VEERGQARADPEQSAGPRAEKRTRWNWSLADPARRAPIGASWAHRTRGGLVAAPARTGSVSQIPISETRGPCAPRLHVAVDFWRRSRVR